MSGRSVPSPVWMVLCSTKSQCATMPAISTTLRSWISPHEPRVAGRFSAETRLPASWRSVPTPSLELAHHLRQLALGLAALALKAPDLALHTTQLLLDRSHDALDLLRAPGHLAAGALLLGAAGVHDALRQRIAGLREHVHRDRLQLLAHALAVGAHQRRRAGGAEQESNYQEQDAEHSRSI